MRAITSNANAPVNLDDMCRNDNVKKQPENLLRPMSWRTKMHSNSDGMITGHTSMYGINYQPIVYMLVVLICSRTK